MLTSKTSMMITASTRTADFTESEENNWLNIVNTKAQNCFATKCCAEQLAKVFFFIAEAELLKAYLLQQLFNSFQQRAF